jgi:hypothetical protein
MSRDGDDEQVYVWYVRLALKNVAPDAEDARVLRTLPAGVCRGIVTSMARDQEHRMSALVLRFQPSGVRTLIPKLNNWCRVDDPPVLSFPANGAAAIKTKAPPAVLPWRAPASGR